MQLDAETIDQVGKQINVWLPIVTFIAGILTRHFTMSKAERHNDANVKFNLAKDLAKSSNEASAALLNAFAKYADNSGKPTVSEFVEISGAARTFLYQQKLIADAILSGRVDPVSRDETLIAELTDTAERTIPQVYDTLRDIAERNDLPYPSQFRRENYGSIYAAVEKYGRGTRPIQA